MASIRTSEPEHREVVGFLFCHTQPTAVVAAADVQIVIMAQKVTRESMRRTLILLTILLIFNCPIGSYAHDQNVESSLGIALSAGAGTHALASWHFDYGLTHVKMHPRFSYAGEITYGPIEFIASTNIIISSEVAVVESGTPEQSIKSMNDASAKLSIKVLPITLWGTIVSGERLSPFVRLGIGASKVQFSELYEPASLEDTEFDYWAFGWAAGAGLRYVINPKMSVSLFAHRYIAEGEHLKQRKSGRITGIFVRSAKNMFGVRFVFNLATV